jgi:hypothetical protein
VRVAKESLAVGAFKSIKPAKLDAILSIGDNPSNSRRLREPDYVPYPGGYVPLDQGWYEG